MEKFKISIPFLATRLEQAVRVNDNWAFEATVFNREDLEEENWLRIWENIGLMCNRYLPENLSFHFPVNNSDYVVDAWVFEKLKEAYSRACDLGLHGVVVHSNRIRKFCDWESVDLEQDRNLVLENLIEVRALSKSPDTWLALENMPMMDNYGIEIDPLFSFPEDFINLQNTDLRVVWDICHYTNTLANRDAVLSGQQKVMYYPNIRNSKISDFIKLDEQIVHWHFSAFKGVANPDTDEICQEGVIPTKSTAGEQVYIDCLNLMKTSSNLRRYVVLEIQEDNYTKRLNSKLMTDWIRHNENSAF